MFQKKVIPVVVLSFFLLGTSALPSRADVLGDSVQKQKDLENQKSQAQKQLNKLTYSEDIIKNQLGQLEKQIAAAQILLGQKQVAYAQAQTQVILAQNELDQKQKELEDRQSALGERARGIYEVGQVNYLELLFQSSNLSDFITRMDYFAELVDNDRQLLTDIKSQKEQVAQKTVQLQSQRDQAARLQAQAALVSADLKKTKNQQQIALDQNLKTQQATFDNIDRLESEANAMADKIRKLQAARTGGVSGTVSTWPVPGFYQISDSFGWRTHPITHKRSMHTGTDIVAPSGTKIYATGAGVVIMAGWNTAYGNMIIIDHGSGVSSLYGHQSSLNVTEGQSVQANQMIGKVGSTGWSTGAHLHFEVRQGGNPTDPLRFFPN